MAQETRFILHILYIVGAMSFLSQDVITFGHIAATACSIEMNLYSVKPSIYGYYDYLLPVSSLG